MAVRAFHPLSLFVASSQRGSAMPLLLLLLLLLSSNDSLSVGI